jgi:hypothetical protein
MQHVLRGLVVFFVCISWSCGTGNYDQGPRTQYDSHRYTAYTEGDDGGALNGYESFVEVERPYYIRGHKVWTARQTIAAARVGLGQLTLKWDDDHHLSVDCRCEREAFIFANDNWRDITVVYRFSR